MRFSASFKVGHTENTDWFDTFLPQDTPLYVDPFLVFKDEDPLWEGARDDIIEFFSIASQFVEMSRGDERSPHWARAERMLSFPEPKEFVLGLSMGSPDGAGTGPHYAREMVRALSRIVGRTSEAVIDNVDLFVLFTDGLGLDRISDIFCNILKARFIRYTQDVARQLDIAMHPHKIKHSAWDRRTGRWASETVLLPTNYRYETGVILCPERFLQDIPTVTAEGFWSWAEASAGETLRYDLNLDLGAELSDQDKRRLARELAWKRPEVAIQYLKAQEERMVLPYDIRKDPKLLVGWPEGGHEIFRAQTPISEPSDQDSFDAWVGLLVNKFKHAVENTSAVDILWKDNGTPVGEKIVQAVAQILFTAHCEAANVDLSKEVDVGRGPVDFKFSQGWRRRALIEVKLIGSSHFRHGAEKQLPQYLRSERISCGYYLCVGFRDADFDQDRLDRVKAACAAIGRQMEATITPVFVDARKKPSASKI